MNFSFDLHVLGTPPAFVLSQDQTLVHMVTVRAHSFVRILVKNFLSFVKPLDNTSSIPFGLCLAKIVFHCVSVSKNVSHSSLKVLSNLVSLIKLILADLFRLA